MNDELIPESLRPEMETALKLPVYPLRPGLVRSQYRHQVAIDFLREVRQHFLEGFPDIQESMDTVIQWLSEEADGEH